jgi:type II secretory pathway pseudopilin PulG
VELLVVMGILAILTSIIIMSVPGLKGSRDLSKATSDVQGVLEQARTYAMATDTYTWVGLFEEDPSHPGTAGTGQLVMCVVASASGTNPDIPSNPIAQLPSSQLTMVAKLTKIPNVHLTEVPAAAVTRPSLSAATPANYQVGSGTFQNPATNSSYFLYPLSATSSATAQYTFNQIIQFSPQGDATRIADNPTQLMEIGLQPSHGNTLAATGANYAVIQISGIGGQVTAYRP